MTETLAHGNSSESSQQELANGYQHDRVWMILKNLCIRVLFTKVASALVGLSHLHLKCTHQLNIIRQIDSYLKNI